MNAPDKHATTGTATRRAAATGQGKYTPDVALADEDTRMVNRFGKPELKDLRLEPTLHEVLHKWASLHERK